MLVTKQEIEKLAHLARLSLSDKNFADTIADDLGNILDFVHQISNVDTKNIQTMEHSQNETLRCRPDVVTEHDMREQMQANIPAEYHAEGLYLVPRVVE